MLYMSFFNKSLQLLKSADNLRIPEINQRLPQLNRHHINTTKLRSLKDTLSYLNILVE